MTQPEVQRLIEDLSYVAKYSDSEHWNTLAEVATELRRLHAQRDALLEALKMLVLATKEVSVGRYNEEVHDIALSKARAAIKQAEENT